MKLRVNEEEGNTISSHFDELLPTVTLKVFTLVVALRAAVLACLMSSRFLRRFNSVSGTVGNFLGLHRNKRYSNTFKHDT